MNRLNVLRSNLPASKALVKQAGQAIEAAPRRLPAMHLLLRARSMADQLRAAEADLAERLAATPPLPRDVIARREDAWVKGAYNLRDRRGELTPWSMKSARELALLCLEAMGAAAFEVDLPDDSFPSVDWSYANAGEALSALAQAHGRVVIYQLDPAFVAVRKEE
jgi:hypothetical protein